MLGRVLRGHEDQHPRPLVLLEQVAQQLGAALVVHRDGALRDVGRVVGRGSNFHAQRLVQQAIGQGLHRLREGG